MTEKKKKLASLAELVELILVFRGHPLEIVDRFEKNNEEGRERAFVGHSNTEVMFGDQGIEGTMAGLKGKELTADDKRVLQAHRHVNHTRTEISTSV